MAIDKNSKAYNSLLNKGYTDDQIMQMYDTASAKGTTQGVVEYDPMADLNPEYIANMDMNKQISGANQSFSQYGDDSSRDKQSTRGGLNEKYTGEGVKTSDINYNPDLLISGLNPNFVYGKQSQVYGTDHPGYISQRNDDIASALYNEGLTSREDVARFLMAQNGFTNSSEEDRLNTIESVWKRLGAIAEQNREKPDPSKAEELLTDTSGKLYGKVTADEGNPKEGIDTLADANSAFRMREEARVENLKSLISMDSEKVGYLMSEGLSPFGEQTMRDLMQYYPEKYQEIQNYVKQIKAQQDINNIASGGTMDVTSQLTASENNVTTSMNAYVNKTASGSGKGTLSTNLNNALAESEIVSGAREQMEVYKRKIVEIQQLAEDLPELANQYFKGDVPDYLVKAFINNRMQQYNKEIEKYQSLYNASLQEAQMEISQQQWREEMNYKWSSLQADQNYKNANLELSKKELEYNKMKAAIANGQWNDDGTYSYVDLNGTMHVLSAEEAENALSSDLYAFATEYIDYWQKKLEHAKSVGGAVLCGQCEQFTDNFARQYFGTEMKGDGHSYTTVEEKSAYATEALPKRGFIAVWDYGIKQKDGVNYGHTGIVIDYDPKTGKFTTLESNVDGDRKLSIRTHSINDAKLQGFRDPSQGAATKNGGGSIAMDEYMNLPNGMLDVFINAEKDSATGDERKYVKQGREAYGILNEMLNNGEIDAIMSGDEMASAVESFTKYLMQNAANRTIVDEDGNFVLDTVIQSFLNSGQTLKPQERDALAHLYRLVQIKLRRDSGAAINIGEWMTDFGMYLPQIGLSSRQKMQRLFDLERAAIESALPGDYVKQYVPLITKEMVNAQSPKVIKEKAKEAFENLP